MTASLVPRAAKRGMSCSSSAVLPEPTGPPMPTRAAPVVISVMAATFARPAEYRNAMR